jgi:hypothetical protein
VGRDGLGQVTQGFFSGVDTCDGTVVAHPEPQGPGLVLVQDGRDRNQTLFEFGQTLFQFNGFVLHERLLTHAGLLPLAYSS